MDQWKDFFGGWLDFVGYFQGPWGFFTMVFMRWLIVMKCDMDGFLTWGYPSKVWFISGKFPLKWMIWANDNIPLNIVILKMRIVYSLVNIPQAVENCHRNSWYTGYTAKVIFHSYGGIPRSIEIGFMGVSINGDTRKSSEILEIGLSFRNHPAIGVPPMYGNPHIHIYQDGDGEMSCIYLSIYQSIYLSIYLYIYMCVCACIFVM